MIAALGRLAVALGATALGSFALSCGLACLAWGLSLYSWLLSLGLALCALALGRVAPGRELTPSSRRTRSWLVLTGLALVLAPPLLRAALVRGDARVSLRLFPTDSGPRLLDTLFPESDGCLLAAGWLSLRRSLRDEEAARFHAIMAEAYARLEPTASAVPTPAIATYLGLQTASAFDTIVIEPERRQAQAALIFLHGYAGNFYVYCWEIAQAAAQAGLLTVCPSVSARGRLVERSGRADVPRHAPGTARSRHPACGAGRPLQRRRGRKRHRPAPRARAGGPGADLRRGRWQPAGGAAHLDHPGLARSHDVRGARPGCCSP